MEKVLLELVKEHLEQVRIFDNFEIRRYENEPQFNGFYSRNDLSVVKNVINPDEYNNIGIHWVAIYINNDEVTYFDSFDVGHISKEIKNLLGNKDLYNARI